MTTGDWVRSVIPASIRPYKVLCNLAWSSTNGSVAAGPFRGTKYVRQAANSSLVPKLLGTYERELFPIVERLLSSRMSLLVDIGAAEGYYAIGFARRCSDMKVIAFDRDVRARELIADLARLNNVADRVNVRGECSVESLQKALDGHDVLVICDVEGYEASLLDPGLVPGLDQVTLLVEVHDALVPGAGDLLVSRFSSTHRIARIEASPRTEADCPPFHPLLRVMPKETVVSLIVERPNDGSMYWLLMEPTLSRYEERPGDDPPRTLSSMARS